MSDGVKMTVAHPLFFTTAIAAAVPGATMAQPGTGPLGRVVEEQVVTGSRIPMQRQQVGSAVTVLDSEFFEETEIPHVAEALRHVPGIAVSRTGGFGGLTQIRLRGAESNHVLVLIDGVDASPAGQGEFDLSSLLTADVERIEVIRGPLSGVYGSNAMAGVVNIITRGGGASGVTASFEGGSFETYQAAGSGRLSSDRGFLTLNAVYRDTGGFSISPTGTEKDGDRNLTLSGRGGLTVSDQVRLEVNGRYTDKQSEADDQDFSGGPMQGLVIDSESYAKTEDFSGGLTGTLSLMDGDWVSTAFAHYSDNGTRGFSGSRYGAESARREVGATSSYRFKVGEAAHTVLGFIEHERETYRNTVPFDPSQVPRQERELLGVGGEYHLGLMDSLYLTGAIRHDDNDAFEDATTYRLSAAYVMAATGSRLHGSHGTGVTNPTFSEQFGFTPGQFVGNPNLEPERAEGWEIGIEQQLAADRIVIDLTYFHSSLEDEISASFDAGANASTVVNAAGRSRRKGVELSLTANPADGLRISGSYTYVDSTDPDGSREVRRPVHMASLDVSYSFPGDRLTLYLGGIYNGERLDNDLRNYFTNGFMIEKTALDAYTVVNAALNYRVSGQVELFGRVENLTDEDYREVFGYATPGVSGFAGLRLRYNASN